MQSHHAIIIIGSGPAGLSAALFAARAQFSPLVISGHALGGQLLRTNAVRNWPGIPLIAGPLLMQELTRHATDNGAHIISQVVLEASLTGKTKYITLVDGTVFTSDVVIIACGTIPRMLQCPGEQTYWNKGVFTKLPEDLSGYANKPVHIIGGGNSAIHFASRLLAAQAHVTLVQEGPQLTATDPLTETIIKNPAVTILYDHTVIYLNESEKHLSTVTLRSHQAQSIQQTSAIFLALGNRPNTQLFENQIETTSTGHIFVQPGTTLTSIPGVFAAGDVADSRYRHAITSSAQGCMAALDAEKYLQGKIIIRF